ncbi:Phosphate-specific transport system accessory protein PhoU [uncultured Desulfobacterium sp.]|uniref:Phosphate-specific transport system accessory protein PhoU n=1 Tax=uncultured Desulfobacterium sp. TaxID=201089 RepID=A0A445MUF0_9BACT|nr:Phosphate-specific transport system accessory protein PhoU [uncultured Desulfobacterium sp.]
MTIHFQREMDKLKRKILLLGAMVEKSVQLAAKALENRDTEMADKIIAEDSKVDELEVEVEEDCLKILALYQPVAIDLRIISAIIKINNDLERVGDEAVNIAQRVNIMARRPPVDIQFDYILMAEKVESMLKNSLDAMVRLDADLAYKVCLEDDEVDDMKNRVYDRIKEAIVRQPERVGYLINLLLVSRHLERIGDHATNIAEEVIYVIEGKIHRHAEDELKSAPV